MKVDIVTQQVTALIPDCKASLISHDLLQEVIKQRVNDGGILSKIPSGILGDKEKKRPRNA